MSTKYKRYKHTDEQIKEAVLQSTSMAGVLKILGVRPAGGNQAHMRKRIDRAGIDTSHFLGQASNRGKKFTPKRSASEILIIRPEGSCREKSVALNRAMLESGVKYECSICNNTGKWVGQKLVLEVDHINRNWLDNRIENLRFLCPNCHSQQ